VIPPELVARLRRERRLTLAVKVIPKASKNEVVGVLEDGSLKVKVTAAPEKGKANAAVCELLADVFDVPKRSVTVISGETSRTKVVAIEV
jgi:hypothetical protein